MAVYACGFNGFQQISQHADTNTGNAEGMDKARPWCALPVRMKTESDGPTKEQCQITWSRIVWTQSQDACELIASSWTHSLHRDKKGHYFVNKNTESVDSQQAAFVDTHLDHIVGSEKGFYCIHDSGRVSQMILNDKSLQTDTEVCPHTTACLKLVFSSSPVKELSCGKEHVLLLTVSGQVFSFGLGSRGQLGHGSVEEELSPRLMDILDGVAVVAVAAGGWHSAAITASGDLFTWGWNESGQLGHRSANRSHDLLDVNPECSEDTEADISAKECKSGPKQYQIPEIPGSIHENPETTEPSQQHTEEAEKHLVRDSPQDTSEHYVGQTSSHSADQSTGVDRNGGLSGGTSSKERPVSEAACDGRLTTTVKTNDDIVDKVSLLSSPFLVTSLPDDYTAVHVSCGSRHTAVVTDEGQLYTTGWNKYGQLGQGHTKSADTFTRVSLDSAKVKDVLCGFWNTVIFTE